MALHIGDLHRVTATFENAAGVATNPTMVTLRLKKPDGTFVAPNPTPVSDGSGVYHYDVSCTAAGTWVPKWFGSGAVTAAEPGEFYVARDPVGAAA